MSKPHAKPINLSGADFDKVMKAMLKTPPPPKRRPSRKKPKNKQRPLVQTKTVEIALPLSLGNGDIIKTLSCKLSFDSIEGFTKDPIQCGDEIHVSMQMRSAGDDSKEVAFVFVVRQAFQDTFDGGLQQIPCTRFVAIPKE